MSRGTTDTAPLPRPDSGPPLPPGEALRDELAKWRERVPKLAQALRQRGEENEALRAELERLRAHPDDQALQQALAERDAAWQRNGELLESTELASRQIAALTDDVAGLRAALQQQRTAAARQEAARQEAGRQDAARQEAARQEAGRHDAARQEGARQEEVQALEARVRHLEAQLQERSQLVVALEQEQREQASQRQRLEDQRDELEEALRRAERSLRENAEHVTQLDDKLERQKALLAELECELAEAHQAATPRRSDDGEAEALRVQLRRLEGLARERTAALGQAQLQNTRLLGRVHDLKAELAARAAAQADDLTRIRGIGPKLAEQLLALGIRRYQQIAALQPGELDDPAHPLHAQRSRIVRDLWIDQAARLAGP